MSAVEPPEELLSAYLDGEVTAEERALVDVRLAESAEWRAVLEEVRETRALLQGLPGATRPTASGTRCSRPTTRRRSRPRRVVVRSSRRADRRTQADRRAGCAGAAAAAAASSRCVLVPSQSQVKPSVATLVNQHAARSSVTEEPVSQLAPVTKPVRLR